MRPLHTFLIPLRFAYLFGKVRRSPDVRVGPLRLGVLRCIWCCCFVRRNPLFVRSARLASVVLCDASYASFSAFVCCGVRPLVATFLVFVCSNRSRPISFSAPAVALPLVAYSASSFLSHALCSHQVFSPPPSSFWDKCGLSGPTMMVSEFYVGATSPSVYFRAVDSWSLTATLLLLGLT